MFRWARRRRWKGKLGPKPVRSNFGRPMIVVRTHNRDFQNWATPSGDLFAERIDQYDGLEGQERVVLLDTVGRVYHYDAAQVRLATATPDE